MPLLNLKALVEAPWFTRTIMTLIIINAVILGMETYPGIMAAYGPTLKAIDHIILWVFVAELGLRLVAYRWLPTINRVILSSEAAIAFVILRNWRFTTLCSELSNGEEIAHARMQKDGTRKETCSYRCA